VHGEDSGEDESRREAMSDDLQRSKLFWGETVKLLQRFAQLLYEWKVKD
jgi:hypothetical protein